MTTYYASDPPTINSVYKVVTAYSPVFGGAYSTVPGINAKIVTMACSDIIGDTQMFAYAEYLEYLLHVIKCRRVKGATYTEQTFNIPSHNTVKKICLTSDGNKCVIINNGYDQYWADLSLFMADGSGTITVHTIIQNPFYSAAALTADGSKLIMYVYELQLANWSDACNNYVGFTGINIPENIGTIREIAVSRDGSRIAFATTSTLYWMDWDGTTYSNIKSIRANTSLYTTLKFISGTNIILMGRALNASVSYSSWNNSTSSYTSFNAIPTQYINLYYNGMCIDNQGYIYTSSRTTSPTTYPMLKNQITLINEEFSTVNIAFTPGTDGNPPTSAYYYSVDGSNYVNLNSLTSPAVLPNIPYGSHTIQMKANSTINSSTIWDSANSPTYTYTITYPGSIPNISTVPGLNSLTVNLNSSIGGYPSVTNYLIAYDSYFTNIAANLVAPNTSVTLSGLSNQPYTIYAKAMSGNVWTSESVYITATPYYKATDPSITTIDSSYQTLIVNFNPSVGGNPPVSYYCAVDSSNSANFVYSNISSPIVIPGFTTKGTRTVYLKSVGNVDGTTTIWTSNIVSGTGQPYVAGSVPTIAIIVPSMGNLTVNLNGSIGGYPNVSNYLIAYDSSFTNVVANLVAPNTSVTLSLSNPYTIYAKAVSGNVWSTRYDLSVSYASAPPTINSVYWQSVPSYSLEFDNIYQIYNIHTIPNDYNYIATELFVANIPEKLLALYNEPTYGLRYSTFSDTAINSVGTPFLPSSFAVTGNTLIYSNTTSDRIYVGNIEPIMTTGSGNISSSKLTLDTTPRIYTKVAVTADGSRLVASTATQIFVANWSVADANYYPFTANITPPTTFGGLTISRDGSRIAYATTSTLYWADWDGTTYGNAISSMAANYGSNNVTHQFYSGTNIILRSIRNNPYCSYSFWNGSTYVDFKNIPQQCINTYYEGMFVDSSGYIYATNKVSTSFNIIKNQISRVVQPSPLVWVDGSATIETNLNNGIIACSNYGKKQIIVTSTNDMKKLYYSLVTYGSAGPFQLLADLSFAVQFIAVSADGRRLCVFSEDYSPKLYWSDLTGILNGTSTSITFNLVSAIQSIIDIITINIAMSGNGYRIVFFAFFYRDWDLTTSTQKLYVYDFNDELNNYLISVEQLLDTKQRSITYDQLSISYDGMKIVFAAIINHQQYNRQQRQYIGWGVWNGKTYNTSISSLSQPAYYYVFIRFIGMSETILYVTQTDTLQIQYYYLMWNGSSYDTLYGLTPDTMIGGGICTDWLGYIYSVSKTTDSIIYINKINIYSGFTIDLTPGTPGNPTTTNYTYALNDDISANNYINTNSSALTLFLPSLHLPPRQYNILSVKSASSTIWTSNASAIYTIYGAGTQPTFNTVSPGPGLNTFTVVLNPSIRGYPNVSNYLIAYDSSFTNIVANLVAPNTSVILGNLSNQQYTIYTKAISSNVWTSESVYITATPYYKATDPNLISITPGVKQLTIEYTPSDGGNPSTSVHYYAVDNINDMMVAPASPFTISVPTGGYHTVYLKSAGNVDGTTTIWTSNIVSAPGESYAIGNPPVISNIFSIKNGLVVNFTGSILGNPPPTTYYYTLDGGNTFINMNTIDTSYTITGLDTAGTRLVQLMAHNLVGNTDLSIPAEGSPYVISSVPPKLIAFIPQLLSLKVRIQTPTDGYPTNYEYWYSFSQDGNYSPVRDVILEDLNHTSLVFVDLEPRKYKIYITAINAAGASPTLMVEGTPYYLASSPVIQNVQIVPNGMTIYFTESSGGNPPPITYYYSLDGINYENSNTSRSPIVLSGLTPTPYTLSLKGYSPTTDYYTPTSTPPFTGNIIGVGNAPVIGNIKGTKNGIIVEFQESLGGIPPPSTYYYSLNGNAYVDGNVQKSPLTITGLSANTSYSVQLYAVNAAGNSPVSNIEYGSSFIVGYPPQIGNIAVDYQTKIMTIEFTEATETTEPIATYEYSFDGNTYTSAITAHSPITIENINIYDFYNVTLRGVYAFPDGNIYTNPSEPFRWTTSLIEPAPIVTRIEVDFNSAIVYVERGDATNFPDIVSYYYSVNGSIYIPTNSASSPVTINYINSGQSYTVFIKTQNVYGIYSDAVKITFSTNSVSSFYASIMNPASNRRRPIYVGPQPKYTVLPSSINNTAISSAAQFSEYVNSQYATRR